MSLSYQDAVRNARLTAIITALGAGAYLEVFTAAPQGKTAGVYNSDAGTKLVSQPLSGTPATVSGGVLTFNPITTENAIASGTPASFRIKTAQNGAASTVIIEGTAGVGSGDLNFNSTLANGGAVSITSATITEGNG